MANIIEQEYSNPVVERAFKTFVETAAITLASTPVHTTSSIFKVVLTVGATFLSVVINTTQTALATHKATKLTQLQTLVAAAAEDIVKARSAAQTKAQVPQEGE